MRAIVSTRSHLFLDEYLSVYAKIRDSESILSILDMIIRAISSSTIELHLSIGIASHDQRNLSSGSYDQVGLLLQDKSAIYLHMRTFVYTSHIHPIAI